MQLIDPKDRCPRCFSTDFCTKRHLCGRCAKQTLVVTSMASAFDHMGPAATLVQRMKYGGQPYLAKGAAAYLALQFYALQWPAPDILVPVPISAMRQLERGYNQSMEIANHLSLYLKAPCQNILSKKSGSFSQAGLSRKLRLELDERSFSLNRKLNIADKIVLLIDDVTTTGSTINRCAEVLQEQCPSAIYALTLCRAFE